MINNSVVFNIIKNTIVNMNMKRIERIVCKVNNENYGDFKNKLNITDENLFELISLYITNRDSKKIESLLNSFNKELVYDGLYGSLEN